MARYEDYVKEEGIDKEIAEASANAEQRSSVPESVLSRFEGKSTDDILNSYAELEKAYSKQGNKMGELRKSFDDYILLQSQGNPQQPVEEQPSPITAEDLYDRPEETISKVVKRAAADKLEKLERDIQQARIERAQEKFESKFPDAQAIAGSPEFANWVQDKPYRMKLAQAANNYDFDAAEELFGLYQDSHPQKSKANKRQAVKNASLESTTAANDGAQLDEVISRTVVVQAKLAAKRGDRDAQDWLKQNAEAIAIAYEEGRVVD